jgi:hypothetical protein
LLLMMLMKLLWGLKLRVERFNRLDLAHHLGLVLLALRGSEPFTRRRTLVVAVYATFYAPLSLMRWLMCLGGVYEMVSGELAAGVYLEDFKGGVSACMGHRTEDLRTGLGWVLYPWGAEVHLVLK